MIYKCRRTASVISRNYNTMARLNEDSFKGLISEYPEYLKFLKQHLQNYNDKKKRFLIKTTKKVDYFKNISIDAHHDIIYSLKPRQYEKGYVLLKPDDAAESVYFIEEGAIEFYTKFEGNEFILERLH
jgi:hypothetical protein